MKKILEWIKKNKHLTVGLCILAFILPLIVVHMLFKTSAISNWFVATWSAGDVLGYIAGFEAFLGTVILGIVSVYQNNQANETNDKLLQMQEELQRLQIKEKASPVDITPVVLDQTRGYYVVNDNDYANEFDVVNQKYKYFFFLNAPGVNRNKAKLFNVVIEVENISNVVLKEIYIDNLKVYDIITNASSVDQVKESIREYIYANDSDGIARCFLKPHEKIKLCLKIDMDEYQMTEESFNINFDLSTMSIYNVIFSANVNLFRNNVVDTHDRVYVTVDRSYFLNMPEAVDAWQES